MKTKEEIRKEILKKIKTQKPKVKNKKDGIIKEKLLSLPEYKDAKAVAFYVSLRSEVDTGALIDEALLGQKRVVVPVIKGEELELSEIKDRRAELAPGPYGVMQPTKNSLRPFPTDKVDLVVVPGVAFTKKGARLGRGRGFYDRFLKNLPGRVKKVGLAYDLQLVDSLPLTPHDSFVDLVITN